MMEKQPASRVVIRVLAVVGCLLLIPVTAVVTSAAKARTADGPNVFFSGGPLVAGDLHRGADPDWGFLDDIQTIELQLADPPRSRRIWATHHDGKLYVWSGYMSTTVGRLWKGWPVDAERDGRAVLRMGGTRYERQLQRITSGPELDGITAAIRDKYPSQLTREGVEAGGSWLFEAAPR